MIRTVAQQQAPNDPSLGPPLSEAKAIGVNVPMPEMLRNRIYAARPEDSTLNHAGLRHELAEARLLQGKTITPFATHAGISPILEENMAVRNDPEAQRVLGLARRRHPDDVLAARLIRQGGGLPGQPLPLGGRAEAAMTRGLIRHKRQLSSDATQMNTDYGIRGYNIPTEVPGRWRELAMKGLLG
jgi:hypothetical protein